jgi:uncharacterized integral membrane protein (TIGR00698 family)
MTLRHPLDRLPGILLAAVIAVPAWFIGKAVPVVGGPILGILFGMLLAFWRRPSWFDPGIKFTSKKILQYAIILLGFQMNLLNVLKVGQQTLLLMVFTLSATFVTAYLASRLLKVDGTVATLVGVGTAICGGSAIAATAPVIDADDQDVAHSISTIFLFNVIAAFLFPALGRAFGMTDHTFGLWAGTAINDTSSVVAAGFSYSDAAGNLAVVVKLTRTLTIVPVTLALALYMSSKTKGRGAGGDGARRRVGFVRIFPWFVLGFAAASMINTFTPIPATVSSHLADAGKFLIVVAMAAIGLNTNLVKLAKSGLRPIVLGLTCWAVLAAVSLVVQYGIAHL